MRLLNTQSLELQLFTPEQAPDYVILSHRWGFEEVTFDDFASGSVSSLSHPARSKAGFAKVLGACKRAEEDQYEFIWIDSCCIDRSSSAVLQESINSMWRYYSNANICYVYMADVPDEAAGWGSGFLKSEWFDRGWTLQELIAPTLVEFYAADWAAIGTKIQRCDELAKRTYISARVLLNPRLVESVSAASRMSWAAHRKVTREEDLAYSLLGLFQVAMPMLYGEGAAKAFGRLQEVIYNASRDDSLFLYRYSTNTDRLPLLAVSPTQFCPRDMCLPCGSGGDQCLPPSLGYDKIIASSSWATQAHEHLLTTITASRFEASTMMLLLPKAAIPKDVLNQFPGLIKATSYLAILNHTLSQNPDGALCLPVRRASDWESATGRIGSYPILMPDWRAIIPSTLTLKVMFASGMTIGRMEKPMFLDLVVEAKPFYVLQWKPEGPLQDVRDCGNSFRCSIRGQALNSRAGSVICRIADESDSNFHLNLTLKRIRTHWLISDAAVDEERNSAAETQPRLQDRCVVQLSEDVKILISIRRLPCREPRHVDNSEVHVRTQIHISRLSSSSSLR